MVSQLLCGLWEYKISSLTSWYSVLEAKIHKINTDCNIISTFRRHSEYLSVQRTWQTLPSQINFSRMCFFANKTRNINVESYSYHSPYFNHWRSSVRMNGNSIIDNLGGHSLLSIQAYIRSPHVPLVLTFWLINAYAAAQTSILVFLYDPTPVESGMLFQ